MPLTLCDIILCTTFYMRFNLIIGFLLFLSSTVFAQASPKVVSGALLLTDKKAPDFRALLKDLPERWYLRVDSLVVTEKTAVFSTGGATVMLAWLDYPAPAEEIQISAAISWLWKDAERLAPTHTSQLVLSVVGESDPLLMRQVFMRTAAGMLTALPTSLGVYMSDSYLLLSKGYYEEVVRNMSREEFPLYCWVYFGVLQDGNTSSGYTYGMADFGWPEFEIVGQTMPVQDSHALLYEVAQKALLTSTVWKDGQEILLTEDRKVKVRLSAAQLIKDSIQTFKVE